MILGGCVTTGEPPIERSLPPPSSVVLDPVPVPVIRAGDDARVAWKKEQAARKEANNRLRKSRTIYSGVRDIYGGK